MINIRPEFSIVIASYLKVNYLRASLRGLECLQTTHSFEVVVINDGSPDSTRSFLESYAAPFELRCVHTSNRGLAATRNQGIEEARGELLLILDNDCLVSAETLDALWKAHRKDPDCIYISTIAHVPIENVAEIMKHLADGTMTYPIAPTMLIDTAHESPLQRVLRLVKTHMHGLETGWFGAQGPSVCAARELLVALGGYDTNIQSYGMEDFDLAFRHHCCQGRFVVVPESVVYHLDHGHRATTLFSAAAKSTGYFYRKHRHLPEIVPVLQFLSGELSFLECNNRIAAMVGKPLCADPDLDIRFSVYDMIRMRQEQLHAELACDAVRNS